MAVNNFKRLEDDQLRRNPQAPPNVEERIGSSMNFIRMVSNVLELYIPRVFEVFVSMTGGGSRSDEKDTPPNSFNPNNRTNDVGPSHPPHQNK